MDSQHSDAASTLEHLQHAIWHGDWADVDRFAQHLSTELTESEPLLLRQRLAHLHAALESVKARRSEMASSLARIQIVSRFSGRHEKRQNSAGSPLF